MSEMLRTKPQLFADGANALPSRVQVLRTGDFQYGFEDLMVTPEMLSSMKKNFDMNVRGVDLAIDYGHNAYDEAAGWIKNLELSADGQELWATVAWTPGGEQKVQSKEFRYLSADFMLDYKDNEGGTAYGPTLMGAGLTNRPFVKEMQPIVQLADGKSDREKLRAAQAARSKKYGIQVLADGALSAPSGGPSDEAAFGDPVNYKYPMADKAHASNAHARFAQNSGSYSDAASRNKVYERIVRKELSFGIKPSFDPKNALDSALPSDLKAKLNSKGGSKMDEKDQEIAALKASVETMKAEKTSVETELGSLRTQLADLNKAKELAEKTAQFEKFLSEGKLCPAQKEAFLANDSVKLAELAATVKTEVKGHGGSENPADPVENLDARDAAKEMIKLAEKLQSEGKSPNFREALLRARKENPELLKRLG